MEPVIFDHMRFLIQEGRSGWAQETRGGWVVVVGGRVARRGSEAG